VTSKGPTAGQLPEHVVSRPDELPAFLEHLAACPHFGLDTEFVGEDTYHPQLCLVQVATPERLSLIDPLTVGPLERFWQLVADPRHLVIVHAGREEARMCQFFAGQTPGNLFDLQLAAGLIGLVYPMGHGSLVHHLLGVQLLKGETRTEWRSRPLTRQQVQYAFDDVRFLLPLWEKLHGELTALKRTEWAKEEFARLADSAGGNDAEVVEEKWRKLRGLGSLGKAQLAGVRALFRWREEQAARTNKTPRSLLRDDLLVEIARRNPRKENDLLVIRGLPKRNLPAMLAALEQARALPAEQLPAARPRDNDPPQLGLAASILSAVLGDFCARQRLAPNLTASGNDLKLLVRAQWQGRAFEADSLLAEGWRKAHVLPELQAVLTGRRRIRLGDLQSDAPLVLE